MIIASDPRTPLVNRQTTRERSHGCGIMGGMKRYLVSAASLLLLAGCGAPIATPIQTPTPTLTAATPQQLASIITGKESDWREVIDGAGECRFLWTMAEGATEKTEAMTCYVRETTIVMSSETAAEDLRSLTPPSDMQSLVADTLDVLDSISAVDLEGVCGDAFEGPKDSGTCDRTLGVLISSYRDLEDVLDRWKPYHAVG